MFQERAEEVVVFGVFFHEIKGTTGEIHDDFFAFENAHFLPNQKVQERADEHSWFVLGSLYINNRAID
jgi:hypothetical protein